MDFVKLPDPAKPSGKAWNTLHPEARYMHRIMHVPKKEMAPQQRRAREKTQPPTIAKMGKKNIISKCAANSVV
jgi:hypothetical protein